MSKRFEYALQPVLLTRQWALDAALLELQDMNQKVQEAREVADKLREEIKAVSAAWAAESEQGLRADRYALVTRYLADLSVRLAEQDKVVQELEEERLQLVDKVAQAKRSVEAAEKHRDEEEAKFKRERARVEFAQADDQWSLSQSGQAGGEDE